MQIGCKAWTGSVLGYADVQDAIRCAQENSLKEGIKKGREEGREQGMQQEHLPLSSFCTHKGRPTWDGLCEILYCWRLSSIRRGHSGRKNRSFCFYSHS